MKLVEITDRHTIEYYDALHAESVANARSAGLCGEPSYAMGEVCLLAPDHGGEHQSRHWLWTHGQPMHPIGTL